tara:strand:+ start:6430 stop:7527 length:1098 start_codon:yes stop_codon:yes gene_type:complete
MNLELKNFDDIEFKSLSTSANKYKKIILGKKIFTTKNLRQKLFHIIEKLELNGILEINRESTQRDHGFWGRSESQLRYLLSIISSGAFEMYENYSEKIIFKKNLNTRNYRNDFSGGITLGYITDGKDLKIINKTLSGLKELIFDGNIEVIICGPESIKTDLVKVPNMICISDYKHNDLRPPITVKKNLIINSSSSENLILAHDRFYFDSKFFYMMISFGNQFDFYNCRRCDLNIFPIEKRVHGDYVSFNFPIDSFSGNRSFKDISYDSTNPDIFLNGGLFIGKTKIFKKIPLNEKLFWGDLEDIHFTNEIKHNGYVIFNDFNNRCFTSTKRLGHVRSPVKNMFRNILDWIQKFIFLLIHGKNNFD